MRVPLINGRLNLPLEYANNNNLAKWIPPDAEN
jgi:hypothetical protein